MDGAKLSDDELNEWRVLRGDDHERQKAVTGKAIDLAALMSRIAFGGATDDLIRWDALHERLARSPPPITDAERCDVLMRLANGEKITAKQWSSLMGTASLSAPVGKAIALSQSQRQGIVDALQLRVENEHQKLAKNLRAFAASSVLLAPSISNDQPRFTVIARDAQGALVYALSLFMDSAQKFGDELCRCQLRSCGRFFFVERKPGKPARLYCCKEHRVEADRLGARKRSADRYEPKRQKSKSQQKRVAR
jgi:hypothetical protein